MLPMHVTPIGSGALLAEPGDALDPGAPEQYLDELAALIRRHGARTFFYDLQHVPVVDQVYYEWLVSIHRLCSLLGAEFVPLHIRPAAAFALTRLLSAPPPFRCVAEVDNVKKRA
ncbi:MAG: STAS domain-containing protein [Acidiferrobacteraceae bacterium]